MKERCFLATAHFVQICMSPLPFRLQHQLAKNCGDRHSFYNLLMYFIAKGWLPNTSKRTIPYIWLPQLETCKKMDQCAVSNKNALRTFHNHWDLKAYIYWGAFGVREFVRSSVGAGVSFIYSLFSCNRRAYFSRTPYNSRNALPHPERDKDRDGTGAREVRQI